MLKKILISLVLATPALLSARTIEPLTQAVLNAYAEILQENPSDYTTLYQRALQLYQLEMYDEALVDVNHALSLTPDSDKELKAKIYELQGSIFAMQQQYQSAVNSARAALKLQPDNYEINYRLGEFCLLANDINGARAAFISMQRKQTRSPEAMLGLARVDIAQGKIDDALQKMKYAEGFNSTLWTTQHSIGNIYAQINQPQQATLSYIKAIALADGQSLPLESLFKLASSNYSAVKNVIEETIAKSPNSAAMPLLLGNVAFETGHYHDAGLALSRVLEHSRGQQPGIYSLLAECMMAQGRNDEALTYANRAVELSPKSQFLTIKARALLYNNNATLALTTAQQAVYDQPAYLPAYMEEIYAMAALKQYNAAIAELDKALQLEPSDISTLVLAAIIHDMVDNGSGLQFYNRALTAEASTPAQTALKGLAQLKCGKILDGDATLLTLIKNPTADNCYWAAVAYANAGDNTKAAALAMQAREAGFENIYLLDKASGPLTLRP